MSAIKETVIACKQCKRKYVNIETQGEICDSCQQEMMSEANLYSALKETRLQFSNMSISKIAKTIKQIFDNAEIKALIKDLENGI